ncbi:MAG: histidine kinase [Beijerinckiaceae bacterium]|nr:histidine kinase [Beijerinckiaceae bacterium]
MTILVRLLILCLLLAGLAYAVVFALATLVEPDTRETTITIPSSKFNK